MLFLLADAGSFTGRMLGIAIGLFITLFVLRVFQEMWRGVNDFMKGD